MSIAFLFNLVTSTTEVTQNAGEIRALADQNA